MSSFSFRSLLLALLGIVLFGCLDQINLEVPKSNEETIIVEGSLIQGNPSYASFRIGRLFTFTGDSRALVNVSSVVLRDETGREFTVPSTDLGIYQAYISPREFPVEVGKSYQVKVQTFDGRTFQSSFEPLLEVPKADSLSAKIIELEVLNNVNEFVQAKYVRFSVHTPTRPADGKVAPFFRWQTVRSYRLTDGSSIVVADPKTCYITERTRVDNIALLNPNTLTTDRVSEYGVYDERLNYVFAEGYYATVYQQALSEGAYTYWNQISQIIERSGNMFEPPAGQLISNMEDVNNPKNPVFGYFSVIQQDTVRLYISPEWAGSQANHCPPLNEMARPDGSCPNLTCCDCLSADGSTLRKPSFWVQ